MRDDGGWSWDARGRGGFAPRSAYQQGEGPTVIGAERHVVAAELAYGVSVGRDKRRQ